MNEDMQMLVTLLTALLLAALMGWGGCHEIESTNRAAIQAGLVQKKQDGSIVWSKP